jgi:hypothetical protein
VAHDEVVATVLEGIARMREEIAEEVVEVAFDEG